MNDMLPQPPPDAPAPPPSEAALLSQKKMRWLLGVGIFSVVCVIGFGIHKLNVKFQERYLTEAIGNVRCFGFALYTFEEDYGSFPSAATGPEVQSNNPDSDIPPGKSSANDCFRQLIVAGHVDQETPFYAKAWSSRKPDHDMHGAKALEKGECPFSYIEGLSTSKNLPETPSWCFH
jgi:hypothetical protein